MQGFTQPELGQTILELRQQKQLTQEELVEKCNLNVRTLQRIEAGEVVPRDYTIRTILTALDYDVESIGKNLEARSTLKWLNLAWIMGIIYFISGFGEVWVDFKRFDIYSHYFPLIYTAVKIIVLVSFSAFIFGFVKIGDWFSSDLLKVASYILIATLGIILIFDVLSLLADFTEEEFAGIKIVESICLGGVEILFGIGIFRMSEQLGVLAKVTGILELVVGGCFVVVILIPIGLFLLIPATILGIALLHKAQRLIVA